MGRSSDKGRICGFVPYLNGGGLKLMTLLGRDSFLLYLHRKCLITLRTAHGVLAGLLRQAKDSPTMLALAVNVGLAVAEFVFLQLEKAGEFVPNLQKGAVLLLAAVDGAGEEAKEIERHEK